MKASVKIPDKPTVGSIITCLNSLVNQLHKAGVTKSVTNIRINKAEKALEIEVEDAKEGTG